VGKKLGILFGFKNGSAGTHVVTYADGTTLGVPVVDLQPTNVTRGDGSAVCTITRGETTTVTTPEGAVLLTFLPDPVEPVAHAFYRLRIEDGSGAHLATMDVIRDASYGEVGVLDVLEAIDFVAGGFVSDSGGSLPLPFLGTRVVLFREPSALERDALLAAARPCRCPGPRPGHCPGLRPGRHHATSSTCGSPAARSPPTSTAPPVGYSSAPRDLRSRAVQPGSGHSAAARVLASSSLSAP
jgi:hypothetical protein